MDIHKQSTGDTERKEDLEAVIQKLNHEVLNLAVTYNNLVAKYNDYSEMTATCNWDRASWPMEDYPKMEFYDASTINETLKSKDIARMKALKRTLWLKVHHLKGTVTNAQVAYKEAKKSFEMREKLWEEDQKRRDEEKEQKRIKEENRTATKLFILFIVALVLGIAAGIFSGIEFAKSGDGWGCGILIGLLVFALIYGGVGSELDL